MDNPRLQPHQAQTLPSISALTSTLTDNGHPPSAEPSPLPFRSQQTDLRDSGNWSASKHSSGVSNNGFQLHSILNSDDSPTRHSIPVTIPEIPYATKGSLHPQALPSMSQAYDHRSSVVTDTSSILDQSRRSSVVSVDSRFNNGMTHLHIGVSGAGPASIYDNKSQNVSRSSLVSNLQQQRGMPPNDQRVSITSPMSPMGQRNGFRPTAIPRRAPIINPNPRAISEMPNPTAENPTKGFPWAFPDSIEPEDDQRRSSSAESDHRRPSRHNSFAASINSSIFTNDSSMPQGQKRFSEDVSTHHHSMQHVSNGLRPGEPSGPTSPGGPGGTYSRTPELRISHKMAERKRRSEMKNLFEDLSAILPSSAGGKSSKWEVLTRAIDYITQTKKDLSRYSGYRQDYESMRREHDALRKEASEMWHDLQRLEPTRPHIYGPFTSSIAREQTQTSMAHALPPIQNQWPAQQPPSTLMQGVEYPNGTREYGRQ